MGGFIAGLRSHHAQPSRPEVERITFESLGFSCREHFATDRWYVDLYPFQGGDKAISLRFPSGDFIGLAGNIIYKGSHNLAALEAVYKEFEGGSSFLDDALGHYAIVLCKKGVLHLFTDRVGAFKVFYSAQLGCFSTSFLTIATALPNPTFNQQAVHEYVTGGAVLGDDSLLGQVRTLPRQAIARINNRTIDISASPPHIPSRDKRPRDELLVAADNALGVFFDAVGNIFGDNICCPLTGGYDSRLIFANLRRRGISPRLFLYRYGANDPNAVIAKQISQGEGIPIEIIDAENAFTIEPEQFPDVVRKNFFNTDGYLYPGLFDNGIEQRERKARTANGMAFLHGSGGEVFRNFFNLPDTSLTPLHVVQSMYGKFDPRICATGFRMRLFQLAIEAKMRGLIGYEAETYDREVVEWLYPNFRGRSWFGRESTINNWFGVALMPFYDLNITDFGASIPVTFKHSGTFEADLMQRADGRIASYDSEYGHSFSKTPPLKRLLVDHAKLVVPPWLRPMMYAFSARRRPRGNYRYLGAEYITRIFPNGPQRTTHLFNAEEMRDTFQHSRMLTVEYLASWLNISV